MMLILITGGNLMAATDVEDLLAEVRRLGFTEAQNARSVRICDAIHVTDKPTARSRYGGIPLVPAGFLWPSDADGPLQLLVEVFVSELKHAPTYFPKDAALLVFHGERGVRLQILPESACTVVASPPAMTKFATPFVEKEAHLFGYIGVPVRVSETVTIGLDMLFDYSDQKRNDAVWKLRERALGNGHHDGDEVVIPGVLGWDVGIRRSSSNDPRIDAVLAEHGWQDKKWFLDREDDDILKEISTLESAKPDYVNLDVAIHRLKSMLGTKSWWSKQLPGLTREIEAWVPVCVVGSSFKTGMMWGDFGYLTILSQKSDEGLINPKKVHAIVESP